MRGGNATERRKGVECRDGAEEVVFDPGSRGESVGLCGSVRGGHSRWLEGSGGGQPIQGAFEGLKGKSEPGRNIISADPAALHSLPSPVHPAPRLQRHGFG